MEREGRTSKLANKEGAVRDGGETSSRVPLTFGLTPEEENSIIVSAYKHVLFDGVVDGSIVHDPTMPFQGLEEDAPPTSEPIILLDAGEDPCSICGRGIEDCLGCNMFTPPLHVKIA